MHFYKDLIFIYPLKSIPTKFACFKNISTKYSRYLFCFKNPEFLRLSAIVVTVKILGEKPLFTRDTLLLYFDLLDFIGIFRATWCTK